MSVNDVICCGAKPLFFLDYIASGRTDPERVAAVVAGVAEGCVRAGCVLLGGETAEMPGFYAEGDYDLAGFAVGIADAERALPKKGMRAGDILIALPSSGVHSNGFSLIRRIFPEAYLADNTCLARELLTPTRIYVKPMLALLDAELSVRSAAHITGGGFYENIPRALAHGLSARINRASLRTPEIFERISHAGKIGEPDMFGTFNMGVGMVAVVSAEDADRALAVLRGNGEDAYVLGETVEGDGEVLL
jgi:phosphoribosylformylglycinamidine cyclo-ligase